ncbi:hypothetical protein QFC20_001623 [Naganishia adeliensis]|uniref:Uncharacterized protein n=1 Tax=Naganishia adeliensis TaxID=92952 RepID=A0ACC2WU95_9TREE|nr:hypothetical protein QFC20_001623 [Naganishia adeliensis]
MSKRTLDAFLVSPATVISKKAKNAPTPRNAGRLQPQHATRSKAKTSVVEVVDIDEVIDVDSPSPPPQNAVVIVETSEGPVAEDVKEKPLDGGDNDIRKGPHLGAKESREYGEFLRRELPFYRVEYKLTRFGKPTDIKTPRFTTVFGVDETSRFEPDGSLIETATGKPIAKSKYKTAKPRPIPNCLDDLRKSVEAATGTTYNYALVNYYATGADSISYHSDDEHFLEKEPAIASFSFLGVRDFLLKHKPLGKDAGKSNVPDDDPAFAEKIAKAVRDATQVRPPPRNAHLDARHDPVKLAPLDSETRRRWRRREDQYHL